MEPTFTVFTPTYNRSKLISRVYESLCEQTYRNFEWLIIDDGSSDNTEEVIEQYVKENRIKITYYKTENRGKVNAINKALSMAAGEFFLVFDSDDWCTKDALEKFHFHWSALSNKDEYCSISCLKAYPEGTIVCEKYASYAHRMNTYIDRFNLGVKGDKWECIRTSIHQKYPYEVHSGERYQAPEFAWLKMGKKYKTLFIDEVYSIIEYQNDGISKNNILYRSKNSNSTCEFYELAMSVADNKKMLTKSYINLKRFQCHANRKKGVIEFLKNPIGYIYYVYDLVSMKRQS